MVTGHILEITTRPPTPAAPIYANECIVVIGQTSAVGAPAVRTKTHIIHAGGGADGGDQFGDFALGTIPQALELIFRTTPNSNVVVIRAGSQNIGDLSAAITAISTDIVLSAAAATTIGAGHVLLIDDEEMRVDSVLQDQITITVTRGYNNTPAVLHLANADVFSYLSVVDAFDDDDVGVQTIEPDFLIRPTRITTCEPTWNIAAGVIVNVANDVVAAMESIAGNLRITAYANAPDGDPGDLTPAAQSKAQQWAATNPSSRVAGAYPHVFVPGQATAIPAGPLVAALTAKNNRDRGYWSNPQGAEVNAISRLSRPIRFDMFDETAASQVLTGANLITFVRYLTGWTLYGNRLMQESDSTDKKRFISRRQTFDQMYRYLQTAVFLAIQAQVGPAYFDTVTAYVLERIRALIARNAIDTGDCYPDRALNTPAELENGDTHFVVEIDGVSDVQSVNFKLVEL